MSYNTLKALVNSKVYENTEQRITGGDMNDVLQSVIASLGAHYQMGGLVSPTDHITVGDEPVVFIATTPGTYTYFGSQVVADGEVALLVWSGTAWSKQTPDISTRTEVSQLGQQVIAQQDSIREMQGWTIFISSIGTSPISITPIVAGKVINSINNTTKLVFLSADETEYEVEYTDTPYKVPVTFVAVKLESGTATNITIRVRGEIDHPFVNVNDLNGKWTTAYESRTAARNDVPTSMRNVGSVITFLLADGWHTEQFINGSWLNGVWSVINVENPESKEETFGAIQTGSVLSLQAGYWGSIENNRVNKYNPIKSVSFGYGSNPSSFNARLIVFDEDTQTIVGKRVFSKPVGGVVTLNANELPYDVNHSSKNLSIWIGCARNDKTAIGYTADTGQKLKMMDMTTLEVQVLDGYALSMSITKIKQIDYDYFNEQIGTLQEKEVQTIVCGDVLLPSGTGLGLAASSWWANIDNVVNKFMRFDSVSFVPRKTGKIVVGLYNETKLEMIETKTFDVTENTPLVVTANEFDYDTNETTDDIGVYAHPYSNGDNDKEMFYTYGMGINCKYLSLNGGSVLTDSFIIGMEIKKTIMNQAKLVKDVTDGLQGQIYELETETGHGGIIANLQDYITNHREVNLGIGTYTINSELSIPDNTKFVGVRGASIVQLGSANLIADLTAKKNITFENITFVGKTPHTSNTSLGDTDAEVIAAIKNRTGAGNDVGFYIYGAAESITFTNCEFKNFGFSGIQIKQTHTGTEPFYKKFKITDCEFHHSWYGLMVDQRAEFSTFVGCSFAYNEIGLYVDGGNNYFGVCHFDKNYINVVCSGISSNNDTHGSMVGCSMNHSGLYGLACIDVHYGYLFNGCMLYEKGILLSNSKNVCFNNGWLSGKVNVLDEPSGQISMIHNTMFGVDYTIGIEGNPQYLSLMGNRFQDARDATSINNNV